MTRHQINEIYEESVYQIRLRVAITLLAVPGIDQDKALAEADKFVHLLLAEDAHELTHKYQ